MLESILKYALSFILEKLFKLLQNKWDEYQEDQEAKEEINKKVKAVKDAKTKEEFRTAIRDLSI